MQGPGPVTLRRVPARVLILGLPSHLESCKVMSESWELPEEYVAAVLRLKGLPSEAGAAAQTALRQAYGQVYRAVAFDVDGTLTDASGIDVDADIALVVGELLQRGVPVVLITGRGRGGARLAAQDLLVAAGLHRRSLAAEEWAQLQRRLMCVTHNGVYLLEAGDQESGKFLSSETRLEPVRHDVQEWHVEIQELLKHVDALEPGSWSMRPEPEPAGVRIRFNDYEQRELALPAIHGWLAERGDDALALTLGTYQGSAMVDVGTADKGRAIVRVANRLDISADAILRVGDQGDASGNDYLLLASTTGFSVDRLSSDPSTCHPVLRKDLSQAAGVEAVRLLLERVHLFPRMTVRPREWESYRRRLARFERTAARHSRTQQDVLIRQLNVRLQSLLALNPDHGIEQVRLGDLFDPRSGAVRIWDWEVDALEVQQQSGGAGFAAIFGLERLPRSSDLDRGGYWCMYSDNSVLLRGPAYYRSLSGPRTDHTVALSALSDWAAFATSAITVVQQLAERPDDPSLLDLKCLLGVMDNVRGGLLQALVIALILDGEQVPEAMAVGRALVRESALPHTTLHLQLMLETASPWQTLLQGYVQVLGDAARSLHQVHDLLQQVSVPSDAGDKRLEFFKWREADHILENVAAVEMTLRRLVPVTAPDAGVPWAVGLAYGGVELPLIAAALGSRAGRRVRPAILRVSMYSDMDEGRRLRDVVLAATDEYLRTLDQQSPILPLLDDGLGLEAEGDENGASSRPLDGTQILLLDDNATTATTLQVARDLALYRGARVLGACLVRFPSPNRVEHMRLQGHGALDLDVVFNVVWGLVAASPYSRLIVPGGDGHLYEDENGVFDKAKQRMKYLLRKNDPASPYLSAVLPQPRLLGPQ